MRRLQARHFAILAVVALLGAVVVAHDALTRLAADAVEQTAVRLALLSRVDGLELERANRDASFHRVANRLLIADGAVDVGTARELVDGVHALTRKNEALSTFFADTGSILDDAERATIAAVLEQVESGVLDVGARAQHLADDPRDATRLEAVGAATDTLHLHLEHARSHIEALLSRSRNRAEAAVRNARIGSGSLIVLAAILGTVAWRRQANG